MSAPARDLRGTWPRALASLFFAVMTILAIRWALFEPYVIPSGSMLPNLLVHDHILVNKFSYGIRFPFTNKWIWRYSTPARGDVVVFKSVEDESVFLVKRVIGLPGEEISLDVGGHVLVNGVALPRHQLGDAASAQVVGRWPEDEREAFLEANALAKEAHAGRDHVVAKGREDSVPMHEPQRVPNDSIFMMGDNRDNSSDSRVWGALPLERVLGRASLIWLSCEDTLPDATQVCDPKTIRWARVFEVIR